MTVPSDTSAKTDSGVYPRELRSLITGRDYVSTGELPGTPLRPTGTAPLPANGKATNPKDAVGGRKLTFSCIPWTTVVGLAAAMLEGCKYGRHNYRHTLGVESDGPPEGSTARASVYFDATQRHLISFWEGEDVDPDTLVTLPDGEQMGLLHLEKAAASLAVWIDAVRNGVVYDDRPPASNVPDLIRKLNDFCGALIDKLGSSIRKPWVKRAA